MQGKGLSLKIAISFILTIGIPSSLIAGYTRYCASSASDLETSARRYESEKSNYESACSSYGYSRNDEGACGTYGYVTSSFKDAADRLKRAISDAYDSCGAPDDNRQYMRALAQAQKEITDLKKRLNETENDLEHLRSKGPGSSPTPIPIPGQPPVPAQ